MWNTGGICLHGRKFDGWGGVVWEKNGVLGRKHEFRLRRSSWGGNYGYFVNFGEMLVRRCNWFCEIVRIINFS